MQISIDHLHIILCVVVMCVVYLQTFWFKFTPRHMEGLHFPAMFEVRYGHGSALANGRQEEMNCILMGGSFPHKCAHHHLTFSSLGCQPKYIQGSGITMNVMG